MVSNITGLVCSRRVNTTIVLYRVVQCLSLLQSKTHHFKIYEEIEFCPDQKVKLFYFTNLFNL